MNDSYADADEFDLLGKLQEVSGVEMPKAVREIMEADVRHSAECDPECMEQTVREILHV